MFSIGQWHQIYPDWQVPSTLCTFKFIFLSLLIGYCYQISLTHSGHRSDHIELLTLQRNAFLGRQWKVKLLIFYTRCRLKGSLRCRVELIRLASTDNNSLTKCIPTFIMNSYLGLCLIYPIYQVITLSVISLSGCHYKSQQDTFWTQSQEEYTILCEIGATK